MMQEIVSEVVLWHRRRNFGASATMKVQNSLGAYLRTELGWSRALPEKERKKIAVRAQNLIAYANTKRRKKTGDPAYPEHAAVIEATLSGAKAFMDMESEAIRSMEKLAKALPVWTEWAKSIPGIGALSVALIVGEAGDLSGYPRKGHLWKRMGVAVIGPGDGKSDVRQGGLPSNAAKEDWIAHGYNRKRRSTIFRIGDSLVKTKGPYRLIYLARKEFERDKARKSGLTVAPSAKIPKGREDEFMSDGHIHRRAQRYMEKRLLKDIWQAWGRAIASLPCERALKPVPSPGTSK